MLLKRISILKKLSVCYMLLLSLYTIAAPPTSPDQQKQAKLSKAEAETKLVKLLGGHLDKDNNICIGDITLDRKSKEISISAKLNMWKGPLEVLLCTKKGRLHESLFVTETDPLKLQLMLILSGATNGPALPKAQNGGTVFNIDIIPEDGKRQPLETWIINEHTQKEIKKVDWIFVGSSFKTNGKCVADEEGNAININSMDLNTILRPPATKAYYEGLFAVFHKNVKPFVDAFNKKHNNNTVSVPVKLILYRKPKS